MLLRKTYHPIQPRRLLARVLSILTLLVFVVLGTFGAFSGGMWGGVGIGLAIILYLGTFVLDRRWPQVPREFLLLALGTLGVIVLLNLGSSNPHQSWYDTLRLTTIFLPLILLSAPAVRERSNHDHLFLAAMLATYVGAFALGVELYLDAPVLHMARGAYEPLTQYNRGISYLILLAMPVMAAIWNRPLARLHGVFNIAAEKMVPFAIFVAALLFPAGLTESRTAKLALILALFAIVLAYQAPRIVYWCLNALVVLLIGWPFAVQKLFTAYHERLNQIPASWQHRAEIWDYLSYRIMEHPWFGWGLGTTKFLDFQNPNGALYTFAVKNAPHPHNVVIQLWVELGLPGLVLGIAFALLTLRQASKLSPHIAPFAFGAWIAALCLSLTAFNFWTDSMFSAFALTGFAFAMLDRRLKEEKTQ